MRCDEAQVLLSTRRDLNGTQRAELNAHLASCRSCATASREEERVTRLLAALPNPDVAPPPRVAAALRRLVTRRGRARELRRIGGLAASAGALALAALVLLNIVVGGRLFGPGAATQTAGQATQAPLGAVAPAAATAGRVLDPGDILYLVHAPTPGRRALIAWSPALDETRFDVGLGDARAEAPPDQFFGRIAPGFDVVIAPDGATVYAILGRASLTLVAHSAQDGRQLWRAELGGVSPLPELAGQGRLAITPDGSRVFVRMLDEAAPLGSGQFTDLQIYDTTSGREAGPRTLLPPETAFVLPLDANRLMAAGRLGGIYLVTPGRPGQTARWSDEAIVAATLLPDGKTIYALAPDLKLLVLEVGADDLRLRTVIDLVPRGGLFFEYAAFAPDGRTAIVAMNIYDRGRAVSSEVRRFRIDAAGQADFDPPLSFARPLTGLALSADGVTAYVTFGPAVTRRDGSAPRGQRIDTDPTKAALVSLFDGPGGVGETSRALDAAIIGVVGAR